MFNCEIHCLTCFRVPFLLDVLLAVANGRSKPPTAKLLGPLALVYSILMQQRNHQLSAMMRQLTFIAIEGHLDDRVFTVIIATARV